MMPPVTTGEKRRMSRRRWWVATRRRRRDTAVPSAIGQCTPRCSRVRRHRSRSVDLRTRRQSSPSRPSTCPTSTAAPGRRGSPSASSREVVMSGALWQGTAYDRRWSLPSLKTFVSILIAPQYVMRWIGASPHLTHLHMINLPLHYLPSALSAAPSLANLTSLGCILLTTDDSDWQPLLSVLETKGAIGRNGRIDTLGVYFAVEGMEPDGILTSLRALDTAIQRFAGVGVSAADTHVTAIPIASWEDHIMTNVISQPHHQAGSSGAAPSFSSAAAACEPPVGGGRRAPLFPNMVPTDDHDDDNASGEMADAKPPQRPFRLFVRMPSGFDDRLLRLGLTASDVLPKKIVREMARVAKSMKVKTVSVAAPAAARGSFGDYVFESLTALHLWSWPTLTLPPLPPLPPLASAGPGVRPSRFPQVTKMGLELRLSSMAALEASGIKPFLSEVEGQVVNLCVITEAPQHDGDGVSDVEARIGTARGMAEVLIECIRTLGVSQLERLAWEHAANSEREIASLPSACYPQHQLFTTPALAARLPLIKHLSIGMPYCVHERFGDVRLDFMMAVINNTPGLKKVEFRESVQMPDMMLEGELRHSPAYLASAAVDEALASAGSPFVVVKTDDRTLTLER
mmetsp:Transcript_35970/g.103353  ORF Transcript_35970/g.103353 Transcript_35970/m.103353 type:complete len:628 (-) Transcript_35970:210-2093(-)